MPIQISSPPPTTKSFALFNLGFRVFFLCAIFFSILAMSLWFLISMQTIEINFSNPSLWHAHEMIFGFAQAMICGFLLTATRNWTGVNTISGARLAGLAIIWLFARLSMLLGEDYIGLMLASNLLFEVLMVIAISHPIIVARQWKQLVIISKVALIALSDLLFFLGMLGILEHGMDWGILSGLYLIIALILLMLRRVGPMFIENGSQRKAKPVNHSWVDWSSIVFFTLFWLCESFSLLNQEMISLMALILAIIHAYRLYGWYHKAIWQVPLLWILIVGYIGIIIGFILHALIPLGVSPTLADHAFAVAGMGMIGMGMMARVSLGHTGRNVFDPPKALKWIFLLLSASAICRVIAPLLYLQSYMLWIHLSQLLWIASFMYLLVLYLPILWYSRVDGQAG